MLEQIFSDKDLVVLARDREMNMMRETIRLQTSQITKQEQLIAQQAKEIEILRQLLSRTRCHDDDDSNQLWWTVLKMLDQVDNVFESFADEQAAPGASIEVV